MSQENVEVVHAAWEAFMRRDNATALALYDPDVEIQGELDDVYRGLAGVREWFREWLAAWDDFSTDSQEWIDAGDNVIVLLHERALGRQSRVPVERHSWHVWTLRDGKLWRLRVFAERREAFEAAGLAP